MVPQTFIFIGRSGCGKGTQSELLHKYLDEHDKEEHLIFYLETGARFRDFIAKDNFTSKLAKKVSEHKESGKRGGDVGWLAISSNFPVEFKEAGFAIKDNGQYAAPAQTKFGWHIIKRLGSRELQPFDSLKAELKSKSRPFTLVKPKQCKPKS